MRHQRTFLASVLLLTSASPALAAEPAGVSAAVQGQVALTRPQGAVGAQVKSGEEIFLQDEIRSGARSGMQILLLDETVFTIGPESEIRVDEFVYDPKTDAGKVTVGVTKGVFRFVTGRVAKKNPADMNVNLPSGTIGVRGTMVAGRTDPVTKASVAVLLGEGDENDTGSPAGAIQVCNAGQCETARRAGYAISIDAPDAAPSKPFPMPLPQIQSITSAVSDPEGVVESAAAGAGTPDVAAGAAAGDGGGDPGEVAGADTAAGGDTARSTRERLTRLDRIGTLSDDAAQDETDTVNLRDRLVGLPPGVEPILPPDFPSDVPDIEIPDNFTTIGQLDALAAAGDRVAEFRRSEVSLTDGEVSAGSYNFALTVDLRARLADLSFTSIEVPRYGIAQGALVDQAIPFGSASDPAAFVVSGTLFSGPSNPCTGGCPALGGAVIVNNDGIATDAFQILEITNSPTSPTEVIFTNPSEVIVPRSAP